MTKPAILLASLALALSAVAPMPVFAEEREFCAERPGQTTPPCTLPPGKVQIETSLATWTRESDSSSRTDTVLLGSSMLRAGITSRLEIQVGWTPYGVQWVHNFPSKSVDRQASTGDTTLGLTYGLAGPNGPLAVQGFVTLPTGGVAIGDEDWSAGLRLPAQVSLGTLELNLTPEIDAAVNESGLGRHLAFGGAVGIDLPVSKSLIFGFDVV